MSRRKVKQGKGQEVIRKESIRENCLAWTFKGVHYSRSLNDGKECAMFRSGSRRSQT